MDQNVVTNAFYTAMDAITAVMLYVIFPIVPMYVFVALLAMALVSSALNRHGIPAAIMITYIVFIFITTLNRASLIIMPLLLLTYLVTEAGVVNDIAVISWSLLFTPIYWLSIPLSMLPSVKGYGIRSTVIFSLLTLLYIIAYAYVGIEWVPITMLHINNLNLVKGILLTLSGGYGYLVTTYGVLSNASLYFLIMIIVVIPPLLSKYLARFASFLNPNVHINYAIMNLIPLLVTTALLYIPLAIKTWSYEATPLLLLGSLIAGTLGYVFDYLRHIMEITLPKTVTARGKTPTIIPIIDPLVIMEYNQWAKKLPSHDSGLVSNVINTVSKTGFLVLQTSLPQDKIDLISKILFGYARAKGFIIKGDINYIPNDVDWFMRTHEKSLLVLMPSNLNKKLVPKLMEYIKQSRANIVLININDSLLSKLRKYGVEVISHSDVKVGEERSYQVNNAPVGPTEQPGLVMTNPIVDTNPVGASAGEDIKARDKSGQTISKEITVGNSIVTKGTEGSGLVTVLDREERTSAATVNSMSDKRMEEGKKRITRKGNENKREVTKVQSKGKPVTDITLVLDPVDIINMGIKSKLIDYVDSSIRLRDMLSSLGLKYVTSILIIGPPKSGKTALINHVAKHLGIQVIDYRDPSISVVDNAIIHVPNLERAFNEDANHLRRLIGIAKAKHFVVILESSDPWSIDVNFIKGNIDAIVPVLPIDEDYVDMVIQEKLKVSEKDREIIKGIIRSCPAVEAIEKIKLYLSGRDSSNVVCEDTFRKFQEFARSLSLK